MSGSSHATAERFRFVVLALQRQGSRRLNAALARLGVTASQAEALEVIGTFGPLTTRRTGDYLVCESGSPSRLLASLADKGLTVRSNPPEDRRATLHALSPAGRDLLDEVRCRQGEFHAELAGLLDAAAADPDLSPLRRLAELVVDPDLRGALGRRFPDLYPGSPTPAAESPASASTP